jgi:proline iminopeptidase
MPTLVIGGAHDTMDPDHMRWVSTQVQHGSFLLCRNGSHLDMWDDQQTYLRGLIKFLDAVDHGAQAVTF